MAEDAKVWWWLGQDDLQKKIENITLMWFFLRIFFHPELGAWEAFNTTKSVPEAVNFHSLLGEDFKYYFADFVRKGGGRGSPQIRNSLFAKNFVRKGGGGCPPYP